MLLDEFDLNGETFIGDDEYVRMYNRAVQLAASDIYKLGVEDEYFQNEAFLSLVDGQNMLDLPNDIYANKIREIIYANGPTIYEVKRQRRKQKFLKEAYNQQYTPGAFYVYRLPNASSTAGVKIRIQPAARETSNTVMKCFYTREAAYLPLVSAGSLAATRAAKIDLPECANFIHAYVMWRIAKKIPHPMLADFEDDMKSERAQMVSTLSNQVDDDAKEVEPDLSHYRESS